MAWRRPKTAPAHAATAPRLGPAPGCGDGAGLVPARVAPHARCERRATAHTVRARAGRVRARADKKSESKSIERMFTKGVSMRGLGKSRPDVGASLGERRRCRRDSLSDSAGGGSSMCRTSSSVGIRGARDCSRLDVARASKHKQGERVCGRGHSGGTALRWGHTHASGERPRPRQRRGERGPRAHPTWAGTHPTWAAPRSDLSITIRASRTRRNYDFEVSNTLPELQ